MTEVCGSEFNTLIFLITGLNVQVSATPALVVRLAVVSESWVPGKVARPQPPFAQPSAVHWPLVDLGPHVTQTRTLIGP